MKTKTTGLILALLFNGVALCIAAGSPQAGTWMLNEAKSKMSPGMGKNTKVVYKPMGDKMKVTVDGVNAEGKATHSEWTGVFDGKDYSVKGDAMSDMRSYKMIDANTLELVQKKGGKLVGTARIVVAADGKSRTVTAKGTDAKGKKFKSISFYDKK